MQQDTEEMANSQQTATRPRRCASSSINFTTVDTVHAGRSRACPPAGVLHAGDAITAVNGTPVDLPP